LQGVRAIIIRAPKPAKKSQVKEKDRTPGKIWHLALYLPARSAVPLILRASSPSFVYV
jgi:hypothetical protein